MATVNFSVPDDVKDAFNATFRDQNKSAVIAELMREAVERVERKLRSQAAVTRILERRSKAPLRGTMSLRTARDKGRP